MKTALQLVDALGTSTRELSDPSIKHVEHFSWAPDGQELLFDAATDSGHEIWRVSADGSGLSRFTNLNAQEPSWSPDGQRIAFASEDGIYVADRAGTNLRRLTTFLDAAFLVARQSAHSLSVQSRREALSPDLWSMNADGTNQKRVGAAGCWMIAWMDRPDSVLCIAGSAVDTIPAMHVLGLDLESAASFSIAGVGEPTLSWTK